MEANGAKQEAFNGECVYQPFIVLSLTSEMLYVLNQRMVAQAIDRSKQRDVIVAILQKAFEPSFLSKLYMPSASNPVNIGDNLHAELRLMFQSFAHASVMRLAKPSMDKLYDLMIMCFKYQMMHLRSAFELHATILNHLDSLELMLESPHEFFENRKDATETYKKPTETSSSSKIIRDAKRQYIQYFAQKSDIEFEFLRQKLLCFVQDQHTRISMFLRHSVQDEKGRFIMTRSSADSRVPFQRKNTDTVDVCYRGSDLGKSLYHVYGRKGSTPQNTSTSSLALGQNSQRGLTQNSSIIDEEVALGEINILTSFLQQNGAVEEDISPDLFDNNEIDLF